MREPKMELQALAFEAKTIAPRPASPCLSTASVRLSTASVCLPTASLFYRSPLSLLSLPSVGSFFFPRFFHSFTSRLCSFTGRLSYSFSGGVLEFPRRGLLGLAL